MSPMLMMLSRTVRRVPLGWQHPRDERGFRPLHNSDYAVAAAEYTAERAEWERGEFPDYADAESRTLSFDEWHGSPAPDAADYMPPFPADAVLGICMYEEVSEGTPISPVYEDTDEGRRAMADYLAAHQRGIEEGMTAADWLAIIAGGLGAKDIHTGAIDVRGGAST